MRFKLTSRRVRPVAYVSPRGIKAARVIAFCGDYALFNEWLHHNRKYFDGLMYFLVIDSIFNVILLFIGFRSLFSFFHSNAILGRRKDSLSFIIA